MADKLIQVEAHPARWAVRLLNGYTTQRQTFDNLKPQIWGELAAYLLTAPPDADGTKFAALDAWLDGRNDSQLAQLIESFQSVELFGRDNLPTTPNAETARAWFLRFPKDVDPELNPYVAQSWGIIDAFNYEDESGALISGMLPRGAVSILYGAPGTLKTALAIDLAFAVLLGKNWLPSPNGSIQGKPAQKAGVWWIDQDSGRAVLSERIAAFARAWGVAQDSALPLRVNSFPDPAMEFKEGTDLAPIINAAKEFNSGLIVIDNLLRFAGAGIDENAPQMDGVMANIRRLAEATNSSVLVIHHSKKMGGYRGHSSIEAGVDSVFRLERSANIVTVSQEKARRRPIDDFVASWTFDLKPCGDLLHSARFWGADIVSLEKAAETEYKDVLLGWVVDAGTGGVRQSDLTKRAKRFGMKYADRDTKTRLAELAEENKIYSYNEGRVVHWEAHVRAEFGNPDA